METLMNSHYNLQNDMNHILAKMQQQNVLQQQTLHSLELNIENLSLKVSELKSNQFFSENIKELTKLFDFKDQLILQLKQQLNECVLNCKNGNKLSKQALPCEFSTINNNQPLIKKMGIKIDEFSMSKHNTQQEHEEQNKRTIKLIDMFKDRKKGNDKSSIVDEHKPELQGMRVKKIVEEKESSTGLISQKHCNIKEMANKTTQVAAGQSKKHQSVEIKNNLEHVESVKKAACFKKKEEVSVDCASIQPKVVKNTKCIKNNVSKPYENVDSKAKNLIKYKHLLLPQKLDKKTIIKDCSNLKPNRNINVQQQKSKNTSIINKMIKKEMANIHLNNANDNKISFQQKEKDERTNNKVQCERNESGRCRNIRKAAIVKREVRMINRNDDKAKLLSYSNDNAEEPPRRILRSTVKRCGKMNALENAKVDDCKVTSDQNISAVLTKPTDLDSLSKVPDTNLNLKISIPLDSVHFGDRISKIADSKVVDMSSVKSSRETGSPFSLNNDNKLESNGADIFENNVDSSVLDILKEDLLTSSFEECDLHSFTEMKSSVNLNTINNSDNISVDLKSSNCCNVEKQDVKGFLGRKRRRVILTMVD